MRAILIAAKQLAFAKTRLAPALPAAAERIALAEAMYRDVLGAALSARLPAMVAVVTSDPTLIAIAHTGRALTIDDHVRDLGESTLPSLCAPLTNLLQNT